MTSEEAILQYRPLLFSIAYNMLGSASLAEDLVQETFLKFYENRNVQPVHHTKAYLIRTITNLAINQYNQAQYQRTEYPGIWLPEPVFTEQENLPSEKADILEYSTMVMLEKLGPFERAVFILKEVLDYDYEAIARFIDQTVTHCRKLLSRARAKLPRETRSSTDPNEHRQLFHGLMEALQKGDHEKLLQWLNKDVALYSDGGGEKPAATKPVVYANQVTRFLMGIARHNNQEVEIRFSMVNKQLAMEIWLDQQLDGIWFMESREGLIERLYIQRAPGKIYG